MNENGDVLSELLKPLRLVGSSTASGTCAAHGACRVMTTNAP